MPRYFTENQGFTEEEMGKTMGLMGVASLIAGVFVMALSDKFVVGMDETARDENSSYLNLASRNGSKR